MTPTDDDLYNLADEFHGDPVPAMRRALELWGGQPPQPRVALAEPRPEWPTLDDILELCADHEFMLGVDGANEDESAKGLLEIARAVLARYGGQPPKPIPVSERLPGPEDCDAEGRCWLGAPADIHDSASWRLARPSERFSDDIAWLPAHAMPMPEGQADG